MKDCAIYIETAIKNSNLKNRAELCRILNIKQPSLFTLEKGKTLPSETTMIKLAELAGMPKEEALIDLNLWRSKNKPELQKVWQRLSKMIVKICLAGFIFTDISNSCAAPLPQQDDTHTPHIIYIMENFAFIKLLKNIYLKCCNYLRLIYSMNFQILRN